jgi:hypothetical protein
MSLLYVSFFNSRSDTGLSGSGPRTDIRCRTPIIGGQPMPRHGASLNFWIKGHQVCERGDLFRTKTFATLPSGLRFPSRTISHQTQVG